MTASGRENSDPRKNDAADAPSEESRRRERRLARGLEDVSYLFLSQTPDRAAEKSEPNVVPEQRSSEPASTRGPILLHPSPVVNRELIISLLNTSTAVLEDGLRAIDANIPCDSYGAIDLLAVDGADRLCIIDVDAVPNDALFLRGIAQFDWILRNIPLVRRMYQGRVVNFSAPPKLFLVAPGFSSLLRCAAQRSTNPVVCCFGYRAAAIPGGVGVLFERA